METNDLNSVTGRMQGLRAHIRRLFLAAGFARVVTAISILLLLSFLLDVLLRLPLAVRWVSAGVALLVVLAVVIRAIVYPLSVRIPDDDLALLAEARLPDLDDRLISALQFRRQLEDPANAESRAMMEAVIGDAASLSEAIEARRLTDARAVRRFGFVAAAAAAAFCLVMLLFPALAGVWAKRNLLLMDLPWPHRTTLVVLGFPASHEIVVTRGETVRVEVAAQGKVPSDVRIGYEPVENGEGEVYRRMFEDEAAPGRFRFDFRQVPESFRFWVVGGDDTDGEPVYTVRALVPPAIREITAACVFPAYTGMAPQTFREGDLDLPRGTVVTLSLGMNMPLESATIVRDERAPEPLALSADGRTATTEIVADDTFDYSIHLTGPDGQENLPDSARFRIRSVPDRKPEVRVLYPGEREAFTTKASVPVKVLATDNYGLSRVSLFTSKEKDGTFTERVFGPDELSAPLGGKEIVAYVMLDATELGGPEGTVELGDEITWYVEATDNNGNTDRSGRYRIEIVSDEDLQRRLGQQQSVLREDLIETQREQSEAWRKTSDLLEYVRREGALEPRDREAIRDDQVSQSKVGRETGRFYTSISRVLLGYVLNRLTTPLATERVIGSLDDDLKADHEDLSQVFKKEFFRRLVADYRKGNIIDQEVLAVLLEIVDVSLDVTDRMSPEAHRLLAGLARGEPEESVESDLAKVEQTQAAILESFRVLDRKMQRWESYAEIIDLVREIRDRQEQIRKGMDGLRQEK